MNSGNTKSGIRKVALQAGVSIATVSRVINESDKVSIATRDRVIQVLNKSGYRPNAAAKALATSRTKTIAAIIPTVRHSIFAIFLEAFEDQLAKAGYNLVIATHSFDSTTEFNRCNEVLHLGAEAIVVSGADHHPQFYETLKSSNIPCFFISVHRPANPYPTFGYDNYQLGESAIEYLAGLGHTTIHVIHGPTTNNDRMSDRIEGVLAAQDKNRNINLNLTEAELDVSGGSAASRDWFSTNKLPHACLCLADILALGVIFEAHRHNVTIPDQMSLMGFENLDWTRDCSPTLTTIDLPAMEMGEAAATALVDCLDNGVTPTHRLFNAGIIERESTRAR